MSTTSRIGGREGCQGLPPTRKSFRFDRACAWCPLLKGKRSSNVILRVFHFPFLPGGFPFSLFGGWAFPFPLRSKVNPSSPPLNLLSSCSWPYGYDNHVLSRWIFLNVLWPGFAAKGVTANLFSTWFCSVLVQVLFCCAKCDCRAVAIVLVAQFLDQWMAHCMKRMLWDFAPLKHESYMRGRYLPERQFDISLLLYLLFYQNHRKLVVCWGRDTSKSVHGTTWNLNGEVKSTDVVFFVRFYKSVL